MRIIISPAKKMRVETDSFAPEGLPAFLPETGRLLAALKEMDGLQLQKLWKCNDSIAALNLERLAHMDLEKNLTPALLSYHTASFGDPTTSYVVMSRDGKSPFAAQGFVYQYGNRLLYATQSHYILSNLAGDPLLCLPRLGG